MALRFGTHAGGTGVAILFDEVTYSGPGVILLDQFKGLVLTRVSGEDVIVLGLKYAELEVIGVGNVDPVVQSEETFGVV